MLVIRKMNSQSYYIVDTSVPGGEDLEHQTSQARAEAALARLQAERGQGIRLVVSVDTAQAGKDVEQLGKTGDDIRRKQLAAKLKGKAGDVRRRVEQIASAADLVALAELEAEGLGRKTVLRAIEQRLEAVA